MVGGNPGKVYVFYHIFCNINTMDTVRDQVNKIIFSGLYDASTYVYCFLTGEKDYIDHIKSFIGILPKKFKVQAIGVKDNTYERFTLNKIAALINNEDKFLYLHTKGITRLKESNLEYSSIYLWRTYMEYFLIKNYKYCLDKLETHDIVGTVYKEIQIGPHFSGNFWWSTGKYYKKLASEHVIGTHYNDPESFIFKGKPNHRSLDGSVITNETCLYSLKLLPSLYMDIPLI